MSLTSPPPSPSGPIGAPSPSIDPAAGYETPRPASPVPMIFGLVGLLISIGIAAMDFLAIPPFNYNLVNLLGYALTPFGVFFCLAWDLGAQRRGSQSPWFDIRPAFSSALRTASIVALIVAVFHIVELGQVLGEWAVQSGIS